MIFWRRAIRPPEDCVGPSWGIRPAPPTKPPFELGDSVPYQSMSNEQWSLLVGLPQSVMTAASAAERDSGHRTHAEGEAGLEAISDGRDSGNPVVEAIAGEVIGRVGGEPEL